MAFLTTSLYEEEAETPEYQAEIIVLSKQKESTAMDTLKIVSMLLNLCLKIFLNKYFRRTIN